MTGTDVAGGLSTGARRGLAVAAATMAGLVAVVVLGIAIFAAGGAGPMVRALLQARLHRDVRFAHLAVSGAPEGLRLAFTDLQVGQPASFGPGVLARAPRAVVVVRPWPLLLGRLEAPEVRLASPELHLRRHGPGDDNWTFGHGGGGASGMLGATRTLEITDGRLDMDDPQRHLALRGAFAHAPAPVALPLSLDGGGVLQGQPFRATAHGGPLNGRKPGAPHPVDIEMQDGAVHLRLRGSSQAPFDFRGLDMDVQAQGPNLADLIYLFHLTAPNSPPFRLTGHMHRADKSFAITRLDAQLGDSDFEGEVRSEHAQRRRIDAVLRSRLLTAHDLRVLLASPPPHAVARTSPGDSGPGRERPPSGRVFSETPVSLRRLQGGDDALAYRAARATGFGLDASDVVAKLAISDGRLTLSPLTFAAAGGTVRVDYAIDTRPKAPQATLTAHVRGLRLARVGGGAKVGGRLDGDLAVRGAGVSVAREAADAQGRASLRVTAGDLPKLDAAALSGDVFGLVAGALDKSATTPLRCVVADFTIAGGVAKATRLVVATDKGVSTGGGEIDLRDEQLHLRLEASSQGPRPLVQLREPITLDGPLSKPHAGMKAPTPAAGIKALFSPLAKLAAPRPASGPAAPRC